MTTTGDTHAVIFDMDGVLINSEPLHCRATQEILAMHGVTMTAVNDLREVVLGRLLSKASGHHAG